MLGDKPSQYDYEFLIYQFIVRNPCKTTALRVCFFAKIIEFLSIEFINSQKVIPHLET